MASTRVPLWQQVLQDLESRLSAGEFAQRFPTDRELVAHYGTSRHTVREAVRHLKARGLIERERGRGSTVTHGEPLAGGTGALYGLFDTVEQAGHTQTNHVLAREMRPDPVAATKFGYDPTTPLFVLERLRLMDEVPMALDTLWLAPDIGRPLLEADLSRTSVYEELAARGQVRPTAGRELVTALAPDPSLAEVLELDEGEALLRIERIASHAGRVVECRLTLLRSTMVALVTAWPGPGTIDAELRQSTASGP